MNKIKKSRIIILSLVVALCLMVITINSFAKNILSQANKLFSLPIGEGEGYISYTGNVPEMEILGPKSFAVSSNEEFYVLDTIDKQIEVYAKDGTAIETIELPKYGIEFIDIEVNKDYIFLLDDLGKIHFYTKSIKELSTTIINLDLERYNIKKSRLA
jgi:hypothetical protein